ncbi:MAG: helix-turn-helix transcriptional regulator [Ilumatobacteraceae bacterium]
MISARREMAGISVAEMAMSVGVDRKTINNYERDRTHVPKLTIEHYANRTDAPSAWFANGVRSR